MGSSTTTSTEQQHSVTQPWQPAIGNLQQILTDSNSLYAKGVGSGVYAGQRVAGLGDDTLTGLQSIRDQAASDNAGAQGVSALQNIMNGGGGISYNGPSLDGNGLSSGTAGALSNLSGVKGVDLSGLKDISTLLSDKNGMVNVMAARFMDGKQDLTTIPQLQQLYDRALAPSAAETNLADTAAGKYLDPTTNPWVSKLAETSADNAALAQKGAFAASGRYGSGAFSGAVAKAVNDTQSSLFADQYNRERANQFSANSMIDSARQAGTQLGSAITGQIGSVQQQNNQNRLAGAGLTQAQTAQRAGVEGQILSGNEFNSNLDLDKAKTALSTYLQGTQDAMSNEKNRVSTALSSQGQALQAAGMLPSLDALRYAPAQNLLGVGSILQGQDQSNIDAAMQSYGEVQDAPWNMINRYAGISGGIGGMGGTTDSYGKSTQKTSQSPIQTLLGSVLGIGGLASKFMGK